MDIPHFRNSITNALALILLMTSGYATAHLINPYKNRTIQDSKALVGRLFDDVHEEITQIALACSKLHQTETLNRLTCSRGVGRLKHPKGNIHDSLVWGVWWNDDPNQLLITGRAVKFVAWMNDADKIAKSHENWHGERRTLNATYNMTYRGHYGDLQFIHGMASRDGESPDATRSAILAYAQFAFEVATGRQDLETTMSQVSPATLRPYFVNQSGWTINYFFAPKARLPAPGHIRNMAKGSLLHMVQDSYSESHTTRSLGGSDACRSGGIVEFHSYVNQDSKVHERKDLREAWIKAPFSEDQNPLNASATLLHFIDRKAEWREVHDYLNSVVFCVVPGARPASPGAITAG